MPEAQNTHQDLSLQFANTVHWHASDHPMETIQSYSDLLAWVRNQHALTEEEARSLDRAAERDQKHAADVWRRALAVREAIYRVFVARIEGEIPEADDLACLNGELSSALAHAQIGVAGDGFVWQWQPDESALDRVLWPILRSAADLLTDHALLSRVGQCADDRGCGWLFLDTSKNRSRRWCDINDCGNRAKQRRHYQRVRQQQA